jgi:hypothetical protein
MPEQLAPTQISLADDLMDDFYPPTIQDDTQEEPDLFNDAVEQ